MTGYERKGVERTGNEKNEKGLTGKKFKSKERNERAGHGSGLYD